MKIVDLENSIAEKLFVAMGTCIPLIRQELANETIYAFTVFCASGCTSMGVAVSTRESVADRIHENPALDIPSDVIQMNAAEWKYLNIHHELFADVEMVIDDFYDCLHDSGFDEEDDAQFLDKNSDYFNEFARDFFTRIVIRAFSQLKQAGDLRGTPFEDDLLLGIQFPDPSPTGIYMIREISSQINSNVWHDRIEQNCRYLEQFRDT